MVNYVNNNEAYCFGVSGFGRGVYRVPKVKMPFIQFYFVFSKNVMLIEVS